MIFFRGCFLHDLTRIFRRSQNRLSASPGTGSTASSLPDRNPPWTRPLYYLYLTFGKRRPRWRYRFPYFSFVDICLHETTIVRKGGLFRTHFMEFCGLILQLGTFWTPGKGPLCRLRSFTFSYSYSYRRYQSGLNTL